MIRGLGELVWLIFVGTFGLGILLGMGRYDADQVCEWKTRDDIKTAEDLLFWSEPLGCHLTEAIFDLSDYFSEIEFEDVHD